MKKVQKVSVGIVATVLILCSGILFFTHSKHNLLNDPYSKLFNGYYQGIDAGEAEIYSEDADLLLSKNSLKFIKVLSFYPIKTIEGTCNLIGSGNVQMYSLDEINKQIISINKIKSFEKLSHQELFVSNSLIRSLEYWRDVHFFNKKCKSNYWD